MTVAGAGVLALAAAAVTVTIASADEPGPRRAETYSTQTGSGMEGITAI